LAQTIHIWIKVVDQGDKLRFFLWRVCCIWQFFAIVSTVIGNT